MVKMICQTCRSFREHVLTEATTERPINTFTCSFCRLKTDYPLNPVGAAKLRCEAKKRCAECKISDQCLKHDGLCSLDNPSINT